ncbi:DUF2648 domain-containing protein, partial [Staphylococcus epidermidis]
MKKLLIGKIISTIGVCALKRYHKHVNQAPNIEDR